MLMSCCFHRRALSFRKKKNIGVGGGAYCWGGEGQFLPVVPGKEVGGAKPL
jgi:hypothetical protein